MQIGLAITVAVLVAQFYLMNYKTGKDIGFNQTTGRDIIAKNSTSGDVIFWPQPEIEPQLVYYAHRNIRYAKTAGDAKAFLKEHGLKHGLIFHVEP
jgi:hypothetical protein